MSRMRGSMVVIKGRYGLWSGLAIVASERGLSLCCVTFTAYAVLVEQSRHAPQADTELLGYLLGRGTRPVKVDHGVKAFG